VTCGAILDGSRATGSGEGDPVLKRALVKRVRLQLLPCVVLTVAGACGRPNAATDFLQARADALVRSDAPGGVILAIVRPNGEVIAASAGHQSGGGPIPTDGRVRIGSVTKTFMAVLVLQLADEGRVDLDAPARTYVTNPPPPAGVTVRDLLQHTSGLPGDAQPGFLDRIQGQPNQPLTPQQILAFTRDVPPLFEPGTGWSYSNTNYIYLGLLVEDVTGLAVANVLRARIIQPLGLVDTYLAGAEQGPPVIRAPIRIGDHEFPYDYPYTSIATSAWTAGAMVSSAADLGTFFRALFAGKLISQSALEEMTSIAPGPQVDDPPSGYGLGLTEWHPAEFPGMELYGHGGGIAGFLTLVFHDPVKGITYFAAGTDLRLDFKPTMLQMVSYINGH
jgi:D-alanyl-D-alanine carboxypeptidase